MSILSDEEDLIVEENSKSEKKYRVYFTNGDTEDIKATGFETENNNKQIRFFAEEEVVAVFSWDQLRGVRKIQ